DGDSAAAMRYTEARMSKIALEMLRDLNKDTVDYHDNYDGSESEPDVLPARFPNLLVNGASGIAVGMATNIPPHNLTEVISALHILMNNPDATTAELMEAVPGPDFPTGGIVMGKSGIRKAYETGKGSIIVRGRVEVEILKNGKERIVISELPYMVNKAKLVERIAELARDKRIEGITDLADESDRDGMRVVIDVRKDVSASVILNNLYKLTPLQSSFGFNMLAIVKGIPKVLGLKQILVHYLEHQEEVIRRRAAFDKRKAEARAHILAGLRIALDHIDEIVAILRGSNNGDAAKQIFIDKYGLSEKQAQAILDMRLVRLTGLEREKVEAEYDALMALIADLADILANEQRVFDIIYTELLEIQERFGDKRRTELLVGEVLSLEDEDLIEEEDIVLTLTHNGYIKRLPNSEFRAQKRGGRGVQGMGIHDDDFIETLISASTHDVLLYFSNQGKVYKTKGYEVPEYGRQAKGLPIINLLNLDANEKIQAIINVKGGPQDGDYLFFTTRMGTVKRTSATEFQNIRQSGLRAINLKDEDELIKVSLTDGNQNIIIGTHFGYSVSFDEKDVRDMGRTATGVRGVKLRENDYVVGMDVLKHESEVLIITENGYGKRTAADEYAIKGRGGKGVKTANITEKNGKLVGLTTVSGEEDIMIITDKGVMIRFHADAISQTGRATLGVRLIKLDGEAIVSTMAKVEREEDEEVVVAPLNEEIDSEGENDALEAFDATEQANTLDTTETSEMADKLSDFADELLDEEDSEE
ncbi:MAG TPA: DNA gyrase subunit A, partial [Trichococcus flocculiformis]|nr:DNA gyrase subunit A [Trichococcus flocculiformis]